MLTYKSYFNSVLSYLCELINKNESHVNTRMENDQHHLIRPPISKHCSRFLNNVSPDQCTCRPVYLQASVHTDRYAYKQMYVRIIPAHMLYPTFNATATTSPPF